MESDRSNFESSRVLGRISGTLQADLQDSNSSVEPRPRTLSGSRQRLFLHSSSPSSRAVSASSSRLEQFRYCGPAQSTTELPSTSRQPALKPSVDSNKFERDFEAPKTLHVDSGFFDTVPEAPRSNQVEYSHFTISGVDPQPTCAGHSPESLAEYRNSSVPRSRDSADPSTLSLFHIDNHYGGDVPSYIKQHLSEYLSSPVCASSKLSLLAKRNRRPELTIEEQREVDDLLAAFETSESELELTAILKLDETDAAFDTAHRPEKFIQ